jgi:hypothetical protein
MLQSQLSARFTPPCPAPHTACRFGQQPPSAHQPEPSDRPRRLLNRDFDRLVQCHLSSHCDPLRCQRPKRVLDVVHQTDFVSRVIWSFDDVGARVDTTIAAIGPGGACSGDSGQVAT